MSIKLKLFFILGLMALLNLYPGFVQAAALTNLKDIQSRMHKSSDSDHAIYFTAISGVAPGQTISVVFPSDFSTTNVDFTDIDVSDDGADLTLAALPNNTTWGAAFGGVDNLTLTITSGTGTITAGSAIIIEIGTNALFSSNGDQAINNPTAAGNYTLTINSGNATDTGQIGLAILNDEQILVNGQVDPTISMSISDLQIGFGHFTNTNIRYATADEQGSFVQPGNGLPTQITTSTNASSGVTISARGNGNGTNAGLWSASASELIAADASSTVLGNTKKYGLYAKNASLLTINAGFNDDGIADVALSRNNADIASSAGIVNNGTIDLTLKAAIDGQTKAGDYTDTITVICTGNY